MPGAPHATPGTAFCVLAGAQCPATVLLGIHNSLSQHEDTVCRLVIYSTFWIDNRTGFNLVFQDLDAPPLLDTLPFLRACLCRAHVWATRLQGPCASCPVLGSSRIPCPQCLHVMQGRKGLQHGQAVCDPGATKACACMLMYTSSSLLPLVE